MRQSAKVRQQSERTSSAEAHATQLELERDALLRVVTDNHVALQRAEAAEAKLSKAVDVIKVIIFTAHADDHFGWKDALDDAQKLITELEKTE
jgi:hypothetical protein